MGAKGDGGLLAVLDLRDDESLQEAGFAREVPGHRSCPCTTVVQSSQERLALIGFPLAALADLGN